MGLQSRLYDSQRDLSNESLFILTRSKTLPSVRNSDDVSSSDSSREPSTNSDEACSDKDESTADDTQSLLTTVVEEFVCDICFTESASTELRSCCKIKICLQCFAEYLEEKVIGYVNIIECVNCDRPIASHNVLAILEKSGKLRLREEYARRLRGDKKCPRCQFILNKFAGSSCPKCHLKWCFRCESTHDGEDCDSFMSKHKVQIKNWAKSVSEGQWNAQRCPKCKVYIQRAAGCDHMHCLHCRTHFCYKCGGKFRHIKFFGDHYSKLSIFGCKYKFKPDKPIERNLIRSAVLVGRLVAIPLVSVGALCGITVVALVAVPIYAGYKLHKKVVTQVNGKQVTQIEPASGYVHQQTSRVSDDASGNSN